MDSIKSVKNIRDLAEACEKIKPGDHMFPHADLVST